MFTYYLLSCLRAFSPQELCERRGGRPGFPSLLVLMVSVDMKQHLKIACISLSTRMLRYVQHFRLSDLSVRLFLCLPVCARACRCACV